MVTTASVMCILFGSTGISLDVCVFDTVEASQCVSCHRSCQQKKDERSIDCFYISLLWACLLLWGGGGEGRTALSTVCYWCWTKVDVCVAVTLVCSLLSPDRNNLVAQMSVIISMRVNLCWDQCRQWLAHLVYVENNIRCQRLAL